MKLENQVVSLELAKKLKELGVKQESLFYWSEDAKDEFKVRSQDYVMEYNGVKIDAYSAFTVAEVGEMLPNYFKHPNQGYVNLVIMKLDDGRSEIMYKSGLEVAFVERGATEAEARGLMLAYLIENNLLSV